MVFFAVVVDPNGGQEKEKRKIGEGTRNRGRGVVGKRKSVDSPSSRAGIPLRPTPPRNLTLGRERREEERKKEERKYPEL